MGTSLNSLQKLAQESLYCDGASAISIKYSFEIFKRFITGQTILELGPAEGIMTKG